MKRKRHSGRPKKEGPWPNCKAKECIKTTQGGSKGFCHTHYVAARRGRLSMESGIELRPMKRVGSYGSGARCLVEGCGNRPKGNNLCHGHWQQKKNGYPLELLHPRKKGPFVVCLMSGCGHRAISKGMCGSHSSQRRNGLIDEKGNKLRDPVTRYKPVVRWRSGGYVLVRAPKDHPRAQKSGVIYEHRLVMEKMLGRYLEEWEIVHHKDGVRDNNDPSNLELMDGRARKGKGHPPSHEYGLLTAVQILLQQELPMLLRKVLESYQRHLSSGD